MFRRLLIGFLFAVRSLSAGAAEPYPEPEGGTALAQPASASAARFIIATANPAATDAGYEILERGGSAVDAAIAAQMVLNLVEPQSSGIGGGAFLVHYSGNDRRVTTFDGRETAPAAARPERFLRPDGQPMRFREAVVGGKSVGVPGVLRALELAHRRHGRLPWASLFQPAIQLADEGFIVGPRLASLAARDAYLQRQPAARAYFHRPGGSPLQAGDRLRNPELAATLRAIAAEGADAFYRGRIAHDIVEAVRGASWNTGDLSTEDLAGYRAVEREPLCGAYRRLKICGMGPPSSGVTTVLQILRLIEPFNLSSAGPDSLMFAHLFSEAGKLAFADRDRYVADPDFIHVPLPGLLDRDYLASRRQLIRLDSAMSKARPGTPPGAPAARAATDETLELPATSHLAIVDRYGNAVAMTTTIEDAFGSRLMVRGFLLNNQLTDFSFLPADEGHPVANRVEAGKRPRSSMSPSLVFDRQGQLTGVVGSAGGHRIINYVAQTLIAVEDWNLDPQRALALAHVGSRNGPTELERGTAAEKWMTALRALGHEVTVSDMTSGTHLLWRRGGRWWAGADPRREGSARGE